jgi:hypothetical protein
MSQSTPGSPRSQQHLSFEYKGSGSGCGWATWVSILLAFLGIVLTIAFGMGWL